MKKQQSGFTLIELIIVIVILGILAVTAAPKFIDIQSDAKGGTVESVVGALKSVNAAVYGKALIAGATTTNNSTESVTVNGTTVNLVFGYADDATDLTAFLDIDAGMAAVAEAGDGGTAANGQPGENQTVIRFYGFDDSSFNYGSPTNAAGCVIIYTEAASAGALPSVIAYTGACS